VGARQWAGRDVIAIDRSASSNTTPFLLRRLKLTNNFFFGDKTLDLESDFQKLGSVTLSRPLIRILRASLVQIDTEMAEKYAKQQQPAVCCKFTFGRYAA